MATQSMHDLDSTFSISQVVHLPYDDLIEDCPGSHNKIVPSIANKPGGISIYDKEFLFTQIDFKDKQSHKIYN